MIDKSKLALAFILGAAAGVAIAYILTTEQGEKTIQDVKDAAGKLQDEAGDKLNKSRQVIQDIADTAERIITNLNEPRI
jgi:hypothetical protein